MNTTTPTFEDWSKGRTPNRNRVVKELAKLIREHANALALGIMGEPYPEELNEALRGAATTALRAEYEATFDTMFPAPTPEAPKPFVRFLRRSTTYLQFEFLSENLKVPLRESYAVHGLLLKVFFAVERGVPYTATFTENGPDLWVHFDGPEKAYKAGYNLGIQNGSPLRAAVPQLNGLPVTFLDSATEPL